MTALERVLRRDRLIVMAGLATIVVVAVAYTVAGVGMPMSALTMTQMAVEMPGMMMAPAAWTPAHALLIALMWWVMMIAMMVPSAAPTVMLYASLVRRSRKPRSPYGAASVFLAGYLIVWAGFSLVATGVQWALVSTGWMNGMMEVTPVPLAAGLLVAAGLYQVSPLKQACLRYCQHPLTFILHNWLRGHAGALRMGLRHGVFCLGCCWVLMVLLFVGGVMNLLWIAGLALYVAAERLGPRRPWLTRSSAAVLVAAGLLLGLEPYLPA